MLYTIILHYQVERRKIILGVLSGRTGSTFGCTADMIEVAVVVVVGGGGGGGDVGEAVRCS